MREPIKYKNAKGLWDVMPVDELEAVERSGQSSLRLYITEFAIPEVPSIFELRKAMRDRLGQSEPGALPVEPPMAVGRPCYHHKEFDNLVHLRQLKDGLKPSCASNNAHSGDLYGLEIFTKMVDGGSAKVCSDCRLIARYRWEERLAKRQRSAMKRKQALL